MNEQFVNKAKQYAKKHILSMLVKLQIKLPAAVAKNIVIINNKVHQPTLLSSNFLLLIKPFCQSSVSQVQQQILDYISKNNIFTDFSFAANNFFNFNLPNRYWISVLKHLQTLDLANYFTKNNDKISLELISANPTGNLHVGHLRNGIIGDTLAHIFCKTNHNVKTVHYVNDYGNQINIMAFSLMLHYIHVCKGIKKISIPDGYYQGDIYLKAARSFAKKYGDKYVDCQHDETKILDNEALDVFKTFGIKFFVDHFKSLFKNTKIDVDEWFYESSMYCNDGVDVLIDSFKDKKFLYLKDNAWWLNTTKHNDDKDRVFIKSDKTYTYIVSDTLYHQKRYLEYDRLINVWGSDHHGYIQRLVASLCVINDLDKINLDFVITQLVSVIIDNKAHKLSKRKNVLVLWSELVEALSVDCARYYMLSKSPQTLLKIDINEIKNNFKNTEYYYCQYAYVRCLKLLEKWEALNFNDDALNNYEFLFVEQKLMYQVLEFFNVIGKVLNTLDPCLLVNYINTLAKQFHYYYNNERIINVNNLVTSSSKIKLIASIKLVLEHSFNLLKIEPLKQL